MIAFAVDVTCEQCRAQYRVDDAKVPPQGIRAKCPKCSHSFLLRRPESAPPDFATAATTPGMAPADGSAPGGGPPADPFAAGFGGMPDLTGFSAAPASGAANPFGASPFGDAPNPFGGSPDPAPFGGAPAPNPFGGEAAPNPFGGAPNPFGDAPNPFAPGGGDPFGGTNPFGAAPPAQKSAFEVRRQNGEQIGPYDVFQLKQMIYEQQLDGSEQILDASQNWVPITSMDELGEIFRLTGQASAGGAAPPERPAVASPGTDRGAVDAASSAPADGAAEPLAVEKRKERDPKAARPMGLDSPGARVTKRGGIGAGLKALTAALTGKALRRSVAALIAVGAIGSGGWYFRAPLLGMLGLSKGLDAARRIAEGDDVFGSGERGSMLTAIGKYEEALKILPEGADAAARLAEAQVAFWMRDLARLDLKAGAEQNLARARQSAGQPTYAVQRAELRFAIANGAVKDAEVALAALAAAPPPPGAAPEGGPDPHLEMLRAELAVLKGDATAALGSYERIANGRRPASGQIGIARAKLRAGNLGAARAAAELALKNEPDNGLAQALVAFVSIKARVGDAAAARKALQEMAVSTSRFGVERALAELFIGRLLEEDGKIANSLTHYRNAVELHPVDEEALTRAAEAFVAQFPGRPVKPWITSIGKPRGSTAIEKVRSSEQQRQQKNLQGALAAMLEALQADGASPLVQHAFGRLQMEIGGEEKKKAKIAFEKAIQIDPDWAPPYIQLARWELESGNLDAARQDARKALELDPTQPEAYQVSAAIAMAEKAPAEAERHLLMATELDPEAYQGWLDLGEARRLDGRPLEGIAALETAAGLRPELAEPRVFLGNAYETANDLAKARQYYAEASKIEPSNLKISTRVGVVEAKDGKYAEARKRLEEVVRDNPQMAEAQYWLGVSIQALEGSEAAVDAYRMAIKHGYPDAYLAHFHIGRMLSTVDGLRDIEGAREHMRACLQLKPDHYVAHEELSRIALEDAQYEEAIKELQAVGEGAKRLSPAERTAVLVRVGMQQGRISARQGRTRDAEAAFARVLVIDKGSAEALWNLGELAKEYDTDRAKRFFDAALKADPEYAPTYRTLGFLLKDAGDECGAKKLWTEFMRLSTVEADRKEIADELAAGLSCR